MLLGFGVEQYEYSSVVNLPGSGALYKVIKTLVGNPLKEYLVEHYLNAEAYYYGKYLNDQLNLAIAKISQELVVASGLTELINGGGAAGGGLVADIFAMYGHYTVQIRDDKLLEFMLKYVFDHKNDWDTNTVFRNINTILSSTSIIKNQNINVYHAWKRL